jgi:hypothetical protein
MIYFFGGSILDIIMERAFILCRLSRRNCEITIDINEVCGSGSACALTTANDQIKTHFLCARAPKLLAVATFAAIDTNHEVHGLVQSELSRRRGAQRTLSARTIGAGRGLGRGGLWHDVGRVDVSAKARGVVHRIATASSYRSGCRIGLCRRLFQSQGRSLCRSTVECIPSSTRSSTTRLVGPLGQSLAPGHVADGRQLGQYSRHRPNGPGVSGRSARLPRCLGRSILGRCAE